MIDPREGIAPDGTIVTGADRSRIPALFEPLVAAAVEDLSSPAEASVYLYGSVATGQAQPGRSDVDLLAFGWDRQDARAVATRLVEGFPGVCRGVEIAVAGADDLVGESDEAYGLRAFLRHYWVHLCGADLGDGLPAVRADAHAARGFNGDIARHGRRWRAALDGGSEARALGRRIARKTLLAVAGLVSVHDGVWTTDRGTGARRWGTLHPELAGDLTTLLAWSDGVDLPDARAVERALDGVVHQVTSAFETEIGLWA
ncbi:MAG: nucleotidyltransferase domain-containing protein [Kineosporiaceae bacterium]